jgi:hypothetical protein
MPDVLPYPAAMLSQLLAPKPRVDHSQSDAQSTWLKSAAVS